MTNCYRYILSCLFLLSCLCSAFGQQVSGSVQNSKGEKIEFASVVVWERSGTKMLNYTTTDRNGNYQLPIKRAEVMITVSSLAYVPDTAFLQVPPHEEQLKLDFILQETTFDLQAVEVSDTRIPYKVEGDTTIYQSDFFTDGTEQVIEDLIRKLPGVSVSEEGIIAYKGKQVDKVLLENDELFGKKYTVGTRSLRADVVDEIQFIDHYIDNPLLKEVAQSDKLAMNITIKEDRKKLLFGDGQIGGGFPDRYEHKLNAFSLYKKHKGILIGSAENTANAPLDMYSLMGRGISFDDPYEYSRSAAYLVHLPDYFPAELKASEVKDGRKHQGAVNLILQPEERLKIKTYALGFNAEWGLQSASYFRDLNLGTGYEYDERSAYRQINNGYEWNVETLWQMNKNANMKYTFNTARSRSAGTAGTIVLQPTKDKIAQELNDQDQVQVHRLNWVYRLKNDKVLVLDGTYYSDTRIQDFNFDYPTDSTATQAALMQNSVHRVKDADLLASLLGKNGSLKYALSLKYRKQTDALTAGLSTSGLLQQEVVFEDQLQQDYRQHFLAMIGSFSTQFGAVRWSSKIELGYRMAQLSGQQAVPKKHKTLYPDLRTGLDIRLNKRSSLFMSASINTRNSRLQEVLAGPFWTSYRSIVSGTERIDPYLAYSGMIGFKHSNNARLLEFSASSLFTTDTRAYVDKYFFEGVFTIREKRIIDGGYQWSMDASLDKYLPALSANLGLDANWSLNRSYLLSADAQINRVHLNAKRLELSYTTVFDGPFNFGIAGSQTWNNYYTTSTRQRSNNQRFGLEYALTLKPYKTLFIKLNTRQVFTNNQGKPAQIIYLGGLRGDYQFPKRLRLGFTLTNVWNTRRFNLEQLGGESYGLQEWRLNPRWLVFNLGLRF